MKKKILRYLTAVTLSGALALTVLPSEADAADCGKVAAACSHLTTTHAVIEKSYLSYVGAYHSVLEEVVHYCDGCGAEVFRRDYSYYYEDHDYEMDPVTYLWHCACGSVI